MTSSSSLEIRALDEPARVRLPPALHGVPVTIAELEARSGGDLVGLYSTVHAAADERLITFAAGPDDRCLAELRPMAPGFRLAPIPEGRVTLSRFAHVRLDGGALVLESPLSVGSVRLLAPEAMSTVWELAATPEVQDLLGRSARPHDVRALVELLVSAELAGAADEAGTAAPDQSAAVQQWEFHDLVFHGSSRAGRHDRPLGGTYRFMGRLDPPPALPAPPREAPTVVLPAPAAPPPLDDVLTAVIGRRASIRQHASAPVTLRELAELLYHACRVVAVEPGPLGDVASRPYPSGGANYELETYVVVDRCHGLTPGFYRYDAAAHQLVALGDPDADTDALLDGAAVASGMPARPQILLAISARFQRQSWKYAGMAYATILKDVGALYATLYLVATALGLAPCALGVGDSERFCRLAGTDRYTEATVGEFMIGSRPW